MARIFLEDDELGSLNYEGWKKRKFKRKKIF
jgi:hypothetical protein